MDGTEPTKNADGTDGTDGIGSLSELAGTLDVFSETGLPQKTYARIPTDTGGHDIIRIDSRSFRRWLCYWGHRELGGKFASSEITAVVEETAARAQFAGPSEYVSVRIGGTPNEIYLDLGDAERRAVKLTTAGRSIVTDPPVAFVRRPGMLVLPDPVPEGQGSIELLRKYVRVNDDQWPLVAAWCCAAYRPRGPHAILATIGPYGDGKSFSSCCIRDLIDPNTAPLRCEPSSERDLVIAASSSGLVAFDNISRLSLAMSDALCRLATGNGFSTRMLYTDDEEYIVRVCRPILINGIDDIITQPDLQSRTIQITLQRIRPEERIEEKELRAQFVEDQPKILGALLDAVCLALQNPVVDVPGGLPRKADFTKFALAAAPALGFTPERMLQAIRRNEEDADQLTLERHPLAAALYEVVGGKKASFQGVSATKVIKALGETKYAADIPDNPTAFARALRKITPTMERLGLRIQQEPRTNMSRRWTIVLIDAASQNAQ